MRWFLSIVIISCILILPNLIWLATSSLRIENHMGVSIDRVGYRACEKNHSIGSLSAGDSVFRVLEACGDDTLTILIGEAEYCHIYVEGELYHVDATIHSSTHVTCEYDDLFSGLFVGKMFF